MRVRPFSSSVSRWPATLLAALGLAMTVAPACGDDAAAVPRCATQSGASACVEATGRSLRVRGTGWAPTSSAAVVVGNSPAVDVTVNGRGEFVVVLGERSAAGAQSSGSAAVVTGSNDGGVTVAVTIPLTPS